MVRMLTEFVSILNVSTCSPCYVEHCPPNTVDCTVEASNSAVISGQTNLLRHRHWWHHINGYVWLQLPRWASCKRVGKLCNGCTKTGIDRENFGSGCWAAGDRRPAISSQKRWVFAQAELNQRYLTDYRNQERCQHELLVVQTMTGGNGI